LKNKKVLREVFEPERKELGGDLLCDSYISPRIRAAQSVYIHL
jgi:hypothetical protein